MIRRRGVAIVENSKGILVVAGHSKKFMLPGGGANRWESRKRATIRELYEETGLKTNKITYLFSHLGNKWKGHGGNIIRNNSKVFWVKTYGEARPRSEIKHIDYWKPKSKFHLSQGAKEIIEKYL